MQLYVAQLFYIGHSLYGVIFLPSPVHGVLSQNTLVPAHHSLVALQLATYKNVMWSYSDLVVHEHTIVCEDL